MIGAILLAWPALALIGAATPRQADLLLRRRLGRRAHGRIRLAGFGLLACSLYPVLTGQDAARALIGWIGAVSLGAIVHALAFSLWAFILARSPVR